VTKILKGRPELENYDISLTDGTTLEVDLGMNQNISDFVSALSENGITIKDFRPKENRLEQLFLKILKN
jgi:ABC-2 type transport system ATP-binding protein